MSQSQIAGLINTTTQGVSTTKLYLPRPLVTIWTAFNKIHRLWRWYRKGKVYSNPDNFLKLAGGHTLNALTDSTLLRVAAVCVLIATRILECVEQQAKLQKAWRKWLSSLKGEFATPVKCTWEVTKGRGFFSISTIIWFKYKGKNLLLRIQWTAISTFHLGKQSFILSMRVMDAIESFSLSPNTRNEGVNELFINSTKWIDKLVENKALLIDGLVSNKRLIENVMSGIHSPITADHLIAIATTALNKTEQIHKTAEEVSRATGEFFTECGKKWSYEFLYNLGMQHLLPRSWIPSSIPPWEKQEFRKIKTRFPPDHLITKPSMLLRLEAAAAEKPKLKPIVKPKTKSKPTNCPLKFELLTSSSGLCLFTIGDLPPPRQISF